MSLFGQTARYLLLAALLTAIVGSAGFYALIHWKIRHEVDELLTNQVRQVEWRLGQRGLRSIDTIDDNLLVTRVRQSLVPVFTDTLVPNALKPGKLVAMRQLLTTVSAGGQRYRVRVWQPYYEFTELTIDLSVWVILFFLVLMALAVGIGLGLAGRLWQPFYGIIAELDRFRLDQPGQPAFPPARVREFALLSRSLTDLTGKLKQQFLLQKQFTENASHELQTPLAIASAELDFIRQSPQLTESDYTHLQRATDALNRLSQLNRSLLLLTQVENDQFSATEVLNLRDLVGQYLGDFEPFFTHKNLTCRVEVQPAVYLRMNRQLAGVLLTNLLKNVARHAPANGRVTILLTQSVLTIRNTGEPLPFAESQLFGRFIKNPTRPDSIGLGLALVRQICDRYQLPLAYQYDRETGEHVFQIQLASPT
ncbi:signal transduction histidine kinase [Spirosoma oryzae]|uniref:histidine kinase n=1 Tax=Spirosoma oryzae TaxID=1469603 RepID=A0A2T0TF23_9BACT|nr:HAMP domain-containing sensor histidine kinase [Spirosoma oryzae]PRY44260.1 signal transduction histidine kinase [Spirosoma oryzae]